MEKIDIQGRERGESKLSIYRNEVVIVKLTGLLQSM